MPSPTTRPLSQFNSFNPSVDAWATARGVNRNISNASFSNVQAIALAKAKWLSGNDIYIGFLGTSTSTGRGAGTGTNGIFGAKAKSAHVYFSNMLNRMGFASCSDAIISTNNYGSSGALTGTDKYADYNQSVTVGSSVWSADTNYTLAGPLFINASAGDTGALTLTPVKAFNTVDIIYSRNSGNALMTLDIAGGNVTDVNANNATADVYLQTITTGAAAAVQAINVKRKVSASSGNFRMVGLIPRDSNTPQINVLGLGWSGGKTSDMIATGNPFSPLTMLARMGALGRLDVVIIKVGENDVWNNGSGTPVPVATFSANLTSIIQAAQGAGIAVILDIMAPQNTPRDPTGAYVAYNQAVLDLAATYNVPVFSEFSLYGGSYATANANGLLYDDVHSKAKGYALSGSALANLFLSI